MKKEELVIYLNKGLKKINEITEDINFNKTNSNYLNKQLPNIEYDVRMNGEIDENFFDFLRDNEKLFGDIKFYTYNGKETKLRDHLSNYFKNIHSKYNEDKMFYFYFELVMMEEFLKNNGRTLPRKDLKEELMNVLKYECQEEKIKFSKCLGKNMEEIDVIVMSNFDNKINEHCKIEKESLQKCVKRKLTKFQ